MEENPNLVEERMLNCAQEVDELSDIWKVSTESNFCRADRHGDVQSPAKLHSCQIESTH